MDLPFFPLHYLRQIFSPRFDVRRRKRSMANVTLMARTWTPLHELSFFAVPARNDFRQAANKMGEETEVTMH